MAVTAEFACFALDAVASTPDADAQSCANSHRYSRATDADTRHAIDAFSICTVADKYRGDSIDQHPTNNMAELVRAVTEVGCVNP